MNLYAYVHGDPLNNTDPTGTMDDFDSPSGGDFWSRCNASLTCADVGGSSTPAPPAGQGSGKPTVGQGTGQAGDPVQLPGVSVTGSRPSSSGLPDSGVPFRNPMVNLFRVVDLVELDSMAANQMRFLPSPNGSVVKYFWQDPVTATAFGNALFTNNQGWFTPPLHLVGAQIQGNLLTPEMYIKLADIPALGSVSAIALPNELLPAVSPGVILGAIPTGGK